MANELSLVRDALRRALNLVEEIIANDGTTAIVDKNQWRKYPNGPLNETGEAEMFRRFEAGESDSKIALTMGVALTGVSKRRGMWRRQSRS